MTKIVTDEKVLRQKSEPVATIEEGEEIAQRLIKLASKSPNVAGLSAIQIGIPKRVFIMLHENKDKHRSWSTWINPEITETEEEKMFFVEGCLSFPGVTVRTHRPKQIMVKDMREKSYAMYDYDSIVFQHENDHLDGVLFFDRKAKSVPPEANSGKNKVGRNEPCPCGSKLKYKKCCGK